MIIAILLFILGLICLIKGGDWFVDGAVGIAERFHMPDILIGATVVSIGTTLPEVMVSASAAVTGHGEIAYGNAIGSIICNAALIAAITITVRPGKAERKTLILPVCFFFGAAVFYSAIAVTTGYFYRWVGIVLLAAFVVYMILTVRSAFKNPVAKAETEAEVPKTEKPVWRELVDLVAGAGFIAVGADLLVDNGTLIAQGFGVPESVIALTFVALGTSLPELVTAITSLRKGHGALSLGNVIGANLFNLVLVSGLATTLSPFKVPASKLIGGMNASFVIDIPVMFAVMLIMAVPALVKQKLSRWQGILLLVIYAGFIGFQFFL